MSRLVFLQGSIKILIFYFIFYLSNLKKTSCEKAIALNLQTKILSVQIKFVDKSNKKIFASIIS